MPKGSRAFPGSLGKGILVVLVGVGSKDEFFQENFFYGMYTVYHAPDRPPAPLPVAPSNAAA